MLSLIYHSVNIVKWYCRYIFLIGKQTILMCSYKNNSFTPVFRDPEFWSVRASNPREESGALPSEPGTLPTEPDALPTEPDALPTEPDILLT